MNCVLIVDDKAATLGPLRATLLECGFETLDASDGGGAIAMAHRHSPCLVLVSLPIPAMDGYRLLREWQADAGLRGTPFVIVSTSEVSAAEERRALDIGARDFIIGPAYAREILARIRGWLPSPAGGDMPAATSEDGKAPSALREYNGTLIQWMEARLAELELANRDLRIDNERLAQLVHAKGARESDLKAVNADMAAARLAALNLIEDAVEANRKLESANRDLLDEAAQRLKAEQNLRSLEQRLRLAVEGAGYGVCEYELEYSQLSCDAAMHDIFGLVAAPTNTLGSWLRCLHGGDRDRVLEYFQQLSLGQPLAPFEFRILRASDQALRHLEAHAYLQPGSENGPACLVGMVRDISERRQNELQLKLLETCVSHLHDIVLITEAEPIDEPGPRIVFANDAFEDITGYAPHEVIGKTPRILQGAGTDRAELDRIKAAICKWQPVRAELLNYTKGGDELWLELNIAPVADASGWFTHWVSVERDISERKKAERAMQESQQKLDDLINSIDGIVWEADARTERFNYVSSRAERLLGYPCDRWIDEPGFWQDHIHPDDRDAAVQFCVDATALLQPFQLQYRMIAADGREIWMDDSINVVAEHGQPLLLRGVMIDITASKQAEKALHDSQRRLRDLINSTDGIVWEVDIRTLQYIWVSSHAERLLGFPAERWHEDPAFWPDRLHPDDRDEAMGLFATCASTLQSRHLQYRMIAADGSVVWLENRVTVTAEAGRLKAIRGVMIDITASKRAQQTIEENEQRFRAVFDQSPMMIALLTLPEGTIAEMNDACLRGFGFKREDIIGRTSTELGVWAIAEERERYIERMRSDGAVHNMEVRMRRSNGELFFALYNGNVVHIADRAYSLNSIQDINELKQAQNMQAALYEISEATHAASDLAELFPRIHEIIGILLPARNFFVALHDEQSDEISFPYFADDFDTTPPPHKFGSGGLSDTVLRTGKPLLLSMDGAGSPGLIAQAHGSIPIDWLGVPLRTPSRIIGVLAVQSYDGEIRYGTKDLALLEFVSDLVAGAIERKRADEALQASERRFSMMFNGSADALLLMDDHLNFIDCNQAAADMLGYDSIDGLIGQNPKVISPPTQPDGRSSAEAASEMVALAMQNGSHRFEWLHRSPHRAPFPAEILLTQLFVDDYPLMMCTMRDISEHKRAQAALLQSNADLEQFAYSVSHDMRQPLRMVSGHLQLLAKSLKDKLDENDTDNLGFALDGARRMDEMIVSLLEYSRVGRESGARIRMPSRESLDEALAFLGPAIADAGAIIETTGTWPDIIASRDEMTRLFQNLVGNASKFREQGQPPKIEIDSSMQGQCWRVCIHDNGIGIAPQQLGRLFQFFSRLQPRTRFEGTGMGLALCRRIVEGHGGRIWAESAGEGQGSSFYFELPLPDGKANLDANPAGPTENQGPRP